MTPQPRIVSATIQYPERGRNIVDLVLARPENESLFKATVTAIFDDGSSDQVLSFYEDELVFAAEEFVGLTRQDVGDLFTQKDIAYLQRRREGATAPSPFFVCGYRLGGKGAHPSAALGEGRQA